MTSSTCSHEGCTRPVHNTDEGKCIFHAIEKDPQEFRNALAQQIRDWRKKKATKWDFRGWVFADVKQKGKPPWLQFNLFRRAVFPVWADFTSATFSRNAEFENATFSGIAWFVKATFSGKADFGSATFSEDAWFISAASSGDVNFRNATFSGGAYFTSATFSRNADFRNATFSETTFFIGATFSRNADFNSAMFSGDANFNGATFSEYAYFRSATFYSALNMSYTCFAVLGDFTDVTIEGYVRLTWPGEGHSKQEKGKEQKRGRLLLKNLTFEKKGYKEPLLNLRGNVLQEDCKLLIHDTNMEKILLEGTDCRLIEFHNVEWHRVKGRRIVGDEHYLRNEPSVFGKNIPSWNKIEETYQQLADRFRKDLKHPAANDFERGIFEARLMAAKQKNEEGKRDWHNRFLLGAYKFASDFSGSIFRPVFWTLLLTVIAAVVYGWLLYDGFSNVTWWPDFGKVLKSAVAALRVASLDRGWFSSAVDGSLPPVSDFVRFILSLTAIIQTLLTAILITLFIFSVRRRFKHTE